MNKIGLLAFLVLAGCATPSPASLFNSPQEAIESTRASVLMMLKDPYSAQFGNITAYRRAEMGVYGVCGTVNSKNSFGAYTGYKMFYHEPNYTGSPILEGTNSVSDLSITLGCKDRE